MDLQHLRDFIAIAKARSFSKAARRLHVEQPTLSRHIQQLEDELGVQLFVRAAKGIKLTREGIVLLKRARIVLTDADAMLDLARGAKRNKVRARVKKGSRPHW
jgi:DNA-binding transcriptional LysR family regulator